MSTRIRPLQSRDSTRIRPRINPLSVFQPTDPTLDGLADLTDTGFVVHLGGDVFAGRSLAAPAAGITISNPNGISGNPTFALANDLAALEGLSGTGIAVRTGSSTWANRTIAGTGSIVVTDGNGVSGNPTISLSASYPGQTSITTLGTVTTGTWNANVIGLLYGGTGASTALGAFNNLSPLTTKGDILTHSGTNNVREPVGTNRKVLMADSAATNGIKWEYMGRPNYPMSRATAIPGSGTGFLDYAGIPTSSVPVDIHGAGNIIAASISVNVIDAARAYNLEILINGAVVHTLALPVSTLKARTSNLNAAVVAGDSLSARLVRTSGAGGSTFSQVSVALFISGQ